MFSMRWMAAILTGVFLIVGCGGGGNPAEAPEGWQQSETRMWKNGVDTNAVFRNLDSLSTMEVVETNARFTPGGGVSHDQFTAAIKRSLVKLYRNNPTIVDSLFENYAAPKLEDVDLSGEVLGDAGQLKPELLQPNKKAAYEAITEYFREPQRKKGASIQYPDSLRQDEEASGEVLLQVHIDSSGAVDAVQVLRSVHPTLDAIAMKAATNTVWEPAYQLVDGEWKGRPAWARFAINFPAPR